jgi:hypothetical protein
MTRQTKTTANRQLSDERHAIGWKVPTEPKPSFRVTLFHLAGITLAVVAGSVVGQWLVEIGK